MKFAIDTNAYVAFCKADPKIVKYFQEANQILIPYVVLAELRAGFSSGNQKSKNESNLVAFLNSERVEVLYPDEDTTFHYARIFSQLKLSGQPIPTNDLWIASLLVQNNLYFLTLDAHFELLPQLLLLK